MNWRDLPRNRVLADVSLWSADLANLAAEIARVEHVADSFHLDVADAHFVPGLLFFPDLIRALRPLTAKPFHVHLMVERPLAMVDEFVECGADLITVHAEAEKPGEAIEAIRRAGRLAGLALRPDTAVGEARAYLDSLDVLLLLGTMPGVKGQDLLPEACDRMREASAMRTKGLRLVADGGIRRHTVQLLRSAGADVVVPGSLAFGSTDLEETAEWLRGI